MSRTKGASDLRKRRFNPKSKQNLAPKWAPGVSGNPGGRPKTDREFKERIDGAVDQALDVVIQTMNDHNAMPQTRFSAAAFLIERSKGKANANVNLTSKRDVSELNDTELAALAGTPEVGSDRPGESTPGAAEAAPGSSAVN